MKKLIGLFFEKALMTVGVLWSAFCILGIFASAARVEHRDNVPFGCACLGISIRFGGGCCLLVGIAGIISVFIL